jgi:PadR family transcriptional regulator, regulatory protein PadR
MDRQLGLLQGTLDMLILKAVSLGPLHGYGVEHQGWITGEWGESENMRKAKYYRLTAAGKRRLHTEADKWNRMADVIAGILGTTPEEV